MSINKVLTTATTAPAPPALNAKDGAIPQEEGPEKGSAKKRGYLQEIHAMQSVIATARADTSTVTTC